MDGHKNSIANWRKTPYNFRKNDDFSQKEGVCSRDLGKSSQQRERLKTAQNLYKSKGYVRVPFEQTRSAVEGEVENTRIQVKYRKQRRNGARNTIRRRLRRAA